MIDYPYDDIEINGRTIPIKSIVDGSAAGGSEFERTTLEFIAEWVDGKESFIQQTSGSTGAPKSIVVTRAQMIASAEMSIAALYLQRGYNALLCISPDYIGGKMVLVRSFVAGMKIIALTPSANPFTNPAIRQRIDFAAMVPYQVHEIVRSGEAVKLNNIRTIIIGGASLDEETREKLKNYSCTFYSTYGMTETISHIALRQLNGNGASDFYRTLPEIRISQDERGCLIIEWDSLAEKIVTNDLVEIVDNNAFRWIGRWDNVINSGGVKIIPENLERAVQSIFRKLELQNAFFVGSIKDPKLGNKVTLFVEGHLSNGLIRKIEQAMAQAIPKLEVPKGVVLLDSFVLTENGKINRKETLNLTSSGM